jgi:hypothetical protein
VYSDNRAGVCFSSVSRAEGLHIVKNHSYRRPASIYLGTTQTAEQYVSMGIIDSEDESLLAPGYQANSRVGRLHLHGYHSVNIPKAYFHLSIIQSAKLKAFILLRIIK